MKAVIMIAGGGTGGHIYPGLALANALQKKDPSLDIHFVGTAGGLETKIVPREGYVLHLIQGGKLNFKGRFFEKIKTLLKLPVGLFQAMRLLIKLKPEFVLGVGGYASGPLVLVAAMMGLSTGIWEPNAHPGLANRMLSRFVDVCFLVFSEAQTHLKAKKTVLAGMPVRSEIEQGRGDQGALSVREAQKFRLLCFGGSQGARAINQALSGLVLNDSDFAQGLELIHQIGSTDWKIYQELYKGSESIVTAQEFIFDMPKCYRWADLVLCRGGASTLTELAAFGLVPIVVPLPAADAHQERNAEALVRAGAAVMILQKDLTPERLKFEIQILRNNPEQRKVMAERMKSFYKSQAADAIAGHILELRRS